MAGDVIYEAPSEAAWTEIATNPELNQVLLQVGREAADLARGMSLEFSDTGEYANSFETNLEVQVVAGTPRSVVVLANTSDHAVEVEEGVHHSGRGHRVLGRVRDIIGSTG